MHFALKNNAFVLCTRVYLNQLLSLENLSSSSISKFRQIIDINIKAVFLIQATCILTFQILVKNQNPYFIITITLLIQCILCSSSIYTRGHVCIAPNYDKINIQMYNSIVQ